MGDMQRAFGVGVQSAPGTPATPTWFNFVEDFSHRPNLTFDVPKFKTNQRWMEKKIIAKTRYDEVTVRGRADAVELGILLTSGFGPPASGVYKAGTSGTPLLTVAWSEGISGLMWRMVDGRVNTLELAYDAANGTITYNATIRGVSAAPATAISPSYTVPLGEVPFGAWQGVLSKDATPLCVVTARMQINNNAEPFYCSPVVAPVSGAEAGLYPKRFLEGEVTGTWDIVYEYTGDAGSSFYDFRHQITEAWELSCTDPNGAAALLLTLPDVGWTSGELDRSKPNVLQHVSGSLLWDPTLLTGAEITLTPGV